MLKLGIIGHPLGHTLSPRLHGALMEHLSIYGEYRAYDVPPEELPAALDRLQAEGLRGLSVTIPHKVTTLPLMDGLSDEAMLVGAINTVVFGEAGRIGHNTDVAGFLAGLPDPTADAPALVLGAGGAARAVMTGLAQRKINSITIAARNPEQAIALGGLAQAAGRRYGVSPEITAVPLNNLSDLSGFELVINTTPLGMLPHPEASPMSEAQIATLAGTALVYDLIYRPRPTYLLAMAEAHGLRTQDGLAMLIHQGIEAFHLWTGLSAVRSMELPALLLQRLNDSAN